MSCIAEGFIFDKVVKTVMERHFFGIAIKKLEDQDGPIALS